MSVEAYIALRLDRGSIPLISTFYISLCFIRVQTLDNTTFLFFEVLRNFVEFHTHGTQMVLKKNNNVGAAKK